MCLCHAVTRADPLVIKTVPKIQTKWKYTRVIACQSGQRALAHRTEIAVGFVAGATPFTENRRQSVAQLKNSFKERISAIWQWLGDAKAGVTVARRKPV
jgi:hypothetical protein